MFSPLTETPTAGPTTARATQSEASIYSVALVAGLVCGLFRVFLAVLVVWYGWNYYFTLRGSKKGSTSAPTIDVLVPPLHASLQVRLLDAEDAAGAELSTAARSLLSK